MLKSCTLKTTVDWRTKPLLPVTVTEYVPRGVEGVVKNWSVDVPEGEELKEIDV